MSDFPLRISELKTVPDAIEHSFKSICHNSPRHPFVYSRRFEFESMTHIITRVCEKTGESVAIRYPHKLAIIHRFSDVPGIFDNIHKHHEMLVVRGNVQGLIVNPVESCRVNSQWNSKRRVIG